MQLVHLSVPSDASGVIEYLDDSGIEYVRMDATGEGSVLYFPLPDEGVDEVLANLREAGLPEEAHTVVVPADTVTTPGFETLREEFGEEKQDESLPPEQLRDQAVDLNPSWLTFATTAVLSAVVVAAGLLRNSAAAVAGAMVIAPYFGTALSVSVGAVSGDRYLLLDGVKHQTVGLALSIASAAAVGAAAREFALVPPDLALTTIGQVGVFLTPTVLSLVVATAAGAAGAIAFATSTSVTLSGVAIAAAIIPSAGVVGLGIAWQRPSLVAGSAALLAMNVLCVNGAAVLVLVALGNRPRAFSFDRKNGMSRRRLAGSLVAALVLVSLVVGAAAATNTHAGFDRQTTLAVHDTLSEPEYDDLSVADVQTEFVWPALFTGTETVRVTVVTDTAHGDRTGLPDALEAAIRERTGRDVTVQVEYVTYEGGTPRSTS